MGCKNYNPSFVNSSTNFYKSAVKDHANTKMHSEAVKLDKIEKAKELGRNISPNVLLLALLKSEKVLRNQDQ